jgi:hypothetical protein
MAEGRMNFWLVIKITLQIIGIAYSVKGKSVKSGGKSAHIASHTVVNPGLFSGNPSTTSAGPK